MVNFSTICVNPGRSCWLLCFSRAVLQHFVGEYFRVWLGHWDLKSVYFIVTNIHAMLIKQNFSRLLVCYSATNCNLVFSYPEWIYFLGYTLSHLFKVDLIYECTSHLSQMEDFYCFWEDLGIIEIKDNFLPFMILTLSFITL